jgi:hypothetical protein
MARVLIRDGKAIVRIGSHRARDKLQLAIGRLPQTYFSWDRGGEWCEVTPAELVTLKGRRIKGITQSAWDDDLRPHTKWGQ